MCRDGRACGRAVMHQHITPKKKTERERIQESYCIRTVWLDEADLYIQPIGGDANVAACTEKHRMTQLIHLSSIMTAGRWRVWERGKMVLMNDFQSVAASYGKQSPSSPQA